MKLFTVPAVALATYPVTAQVDFIADMGSPPRTLILHNESTTVPMVISFDGTNDHAFVSPNEAIYLNPLLEGPGKLWARNYAGTTAKILLITAI